MLSRARILDLLDRQGEALQALSEAEARRMLRVYEDARRELAETIGSGAPGTFTAQHQRVVLAQLQAGMLQLREQLGERLAASARAVEERSLSDLVRLLSATEDDFRDAGSALEVEVLARLSEHRALLLHTHSAARYSSELMDALQRDLVRGVAQGETLRQIRERLAGTGAAAWKNARARADLVVRMEVSAAYGRGHQLGLEAAAKALDTPDDPDPLWKRADEFFDARNHPLSRVLHGRLAPVTEQVRGATVPGRWRVPVAEVAAQARKAGRSWNPARANGVVWEYDGAQIVGSAYPAHFYDRGRMTPWRKSWGEPT